MKKEKILKKFKCQWCGKIFEKLIPKKGKKPFYMYCSILCDHSGKIGDWPEMGEDCFRDRDAYVKWKKKFNKLKRESRSNIWLKSQGLK